MLSQKTQEKIKSLLDAKEENEYLDIKEKWHVKPEKLVKDIICFCNTIHDEDSYIVVGIEDKTFKAKGFSKNDKRYSQADVIDILSRYNLTSNPEISLNQMDYQGVTVDVLTIHNVTKPPIFCTKVPKDQNSLAAGIIFVRIKDRNSSVDSLADFETIEKLWMKRFNLFQVSDKTFQKLLDNEEWSKFSGKNIEYFCNQHPEYRLIEIRSDDDVPIKNRDEFYSYIQSNESTEFFQINLSFKSEGIKTINMTSLDEGRLIVPIPSREDFEVLIDGENLYCRYYVVDSLEFSIFQLFYNTELTGGDCSDKEIARQNLYKVILLFKDDQEKTKFKSYVKSNIHKLREYYASCKDYDHLYSRGSNPNDRAKFKTYVRQLKSGAALNKLRIDFKKTLA